MTVAQLKTDTQKKCFEEDRDINTKISAGVCIFPSSSFQLSDLTVNEGTDRYDVKGFQSAV